MSDEGSDAGTRNVLLLLEYEGTDFSGMQRQPGQRTVQGLVEAAIKRMTGETATLRASSRTDAGVHARGLPANFVTTTAIPNVGLMRGLNTMLPDDLAVVGCKDVAHSFRSRDAAVAKTYCYRFQVGPSRLPLVARTSWYVKRRELDVDAMHAAAQAFLGPHDFSSFRARGCQSRTTIRWMHSLVVTPCPSEPRLIELHITGNAFLRNMVRIVAGTLSEVGTGRLTPEDMPGIIAAADRPAAGITAPARGLTLEHVHFEGYPRLGKVELGAIDDAGAAK